MILVDTSVWIDHLRSGDAELTGLLNASQVLMHPLVLGALACGNLHNRDTAGAGLGKALVVSAGILLGNKSPAGP